MAKKPAPDEDPSDGIGFNMTPMIDVVFQLIIFLMLANDMSRKEIEDLVLPAAAHGAPDLGVVEKQRVIANLVPREGGGPPSLVVGGVTMDLDGFAQVLRPRADACRGTGGRATSDLYVLVRADAATRWQDVQWLLQACAAPGVGVHRIQFAVHDPRTEGR